jgi:hypothetical protein
VHSTGGLAAEPNTSGRVRQRPERSVLRSFLSRLSLGTIVPILVGLSVSTVPLHAQVAAGNVTSLVGSASIERAGSSIDVTVGLPVQVADQVAVSTGGKVTITLSDGSILEVGSSSTIVIDEELLGPGGARASTRVHLLAGILRSVAKHTAGTPPNFEVRTTNAILAARGTTFDTQYTDGTRRPGYGATMQFTDERTLMGTVGARNAAGGGEVSVPAGYETTIAGDSAPNTPGPINSTGIPWSGIEKLTATEPPPQIAGGGGGGAAGAGGGGAGASAPSGGGIGPGVAALPPAVGVISPPPPPPPPPPMVPSSLPGFPK